MLMQWGAAGCSTQSSAEAQVGVHLELSDLASVDQPQQPEYA
jgi:hypothetical protein